MLMPQQLQTFIPPENRRPPQPMTAPGGMGGGASGGQSGNTGFNVSSPIQPQGVFTPQQTRQAMNQKLNQGAMDFGWLTRQHARPGFRQNSPGFQQLAAPQYGAAQAGAQAGARQVAAGDYLANRNNQLAGQLLRADQSLGAAQSGLQNLGRQVDYREGVANLQNNFLAQLLRQFGGS